VFQKMKDNKKASALLLGAMVVLIAIVFSASRAAAQNNSNPEMRAPQTAADHLALADHYQKQAAELRGEVEMHKQMLAEFATDVAHNPKTSGENSYVKAMRLQYERYQQAADKMIAEDTELAEFHTLRAKELEGK